jgi:diketogulonate reductase-like aldo/keto reductase
MKGSVEQALVAGGLIVRTTRHLVVLTLPLVCWLAGQESPTQALLAWVVHRGMALLTTARTAAGARGNFKNFPLLQGALDETNRI